MASRKKSPEEQILDQLGARWSPDFDDYATGKTVLCEGKCQCPLPERRR